MLVFKAIQTLFRVVPFVFSGVHNHLCFILVFLVHIYMLPCKLSWVSNYFLVQNRRVSQQLYCREISSRPSNLLHCDLLAVYAFKTAVKTKKKLSPLHLPSASPCAVVCHGLCWLLFSV